jgi:hypothetical protein
MIGDAEIIAAIARKAQTDRGYADWDSWPDREVRDRGLGRDFAAAVKKTYDIDVGPFRVLPPGSDPPDLLSSDGVGIELTELVDPEKIREAKRFKRENNGLFAYRDWSAMELLEELTARIRHKDAKSLKDPESVRELWLVIHSDEPGLSPEPVEHALRGWKGVECRRIARCFFLMPYFPGHGRPVFELLVHPLA